MANFVLTTGDDAFGPTDDDDFFSGPGGGTDTLLGGDGNDIFEIDSNQQGTIDGGADPYNDFYDTVVLTGTTLNQNLTLIRIDKLVFNTTSFSGTIGQLNIATLTIDPSVDAISIVLTGAGGVFRLRSTTADVTLDASAVTSFVDMYSDKGNDHLIGTSFADVLGGGAGADTLDGGNGIDTASYSETARVDLENGSLNSGEALGDVLISIENLRGGAPSQFFGDGGTNRLEGGSGNDLLVGRGGSDTLLGGNGDDTLTPGAGADSVDGGSGTDLLTYIDSNFGLTANLALPALNTGIAAGDILTSIENLEGSNFGDTLGGNSATNVIWGRDGDDMIYGYELSDTLYGGNGADTLDGGDGIDLVSYMDSPTGVTLSLATPSLSTGYAAGDVFVQVERFEGSAWADVMQGNGFANDFLGGTGNDTLDGGGGRDTLDGGDGDDRILGGNGDDQIRGEAGADWIDGGAGNDNINGGNDNDTIYGGSGDDTINGWNGNDLIFGGEGNDFLFAGYQNATLVGGSGADYLDGRNNSDFPISQNVTASYRDATSGVTASFMDPSANTGDAAGDRYVEINNLEGTAFNDILTGDEYWNVISGENGNDFLAGGVGRDTLRGGDGADTLAGGEGEDRLEGGDGRDAVSYFDSAFGLTADLFNSGNNTGIGYRDVYISIEDLIGSSHNDTLGGDNLDNLVAGAAGNDVLSGRGGADTLRGGLGADTMEGGAGADRFDFNSVAEIGMAINQRDVIIDFTQGEDLVDLNDIDASTLLAGNQSFTWLGTGAHTGAGATLRYQQAGTSTLIFGDVNADGNGDFAIQLNGLYNLTAADFTALSVNRIEGTAGNDVLTGAPGGKIMLGLNGNDTITGGTGADTLWGGAGADSMTGGLGADQFKWNNATHSGNAVGTRDIITDFQQGVDKLDLAGVDANSNVAGDQAFTWLGTAVHTGAGATLRYLQAGGNTLIYGDINGDKAADFTIQLTGLYALTAADFVL